MIETILTSNWAASMAGAPSYGFILIAAPIVSFVAIKLLMQAKSASMNKKRREWVFSQERDADGLPMLAPAKVAVRKRR
jgi:hypothetical protein